MARLHKLVTTDQDTEATNLILDKYGQNTPTQTLEDLFKRVEEWGPSPALLRTGRLIIRKLDREKRYGRSIFYIEKCQKIKPGFVLPDLSRVIFYANLAIDVGKLEVAKNLLHDAPNRYGPLVDSDECHRLLQSISEGSSHQGISE